MGDDDYVIPEDWSDTEIELFDSLVAGDANVGEDFYLQDLFDAALFDPDATMAEREEAYNRMVEYLWDQYDIDFDEAFDWEDFRAWYEAA